MLDNLLREHVIKNVWGSPEKEGVFVIRPSRLSKSRGSLIKQRVMWEDVSLPNRTDRYHVYRIGKVSPSILGLGCIGEQWVTIESIINKTYLLSQVYNIDGLIYPRRYCFLKVDKGGGLILAIKIDERLGLFFDEDTYIKMYTNAFYQSSRNTHGVNATKCMSKVIDKNEDKVNINYLYLTHLNKEGFAWGYKNGVYVNNFNPSLLNKGDILEIFYDASVHSVLDFDIAELKSFTSSLDKKHKYLLIQEDSQRPTIDYVNNIDVFVLRKTAKAFAGCYLHKHHDDSIRMITHKDYSIPIAYVHGVANKHVELSGDVTSLTIRLVIRKGGYDRELSQESNSIHELMKLPLGFTQRAMIGVDSHVPEWHADNLESSYYSKMMVLPTSNFDVDEMQLMLGYDSLVKAYADGPIRTKPTSGRPFVILPPLLTKDVTVYEYNVDGLLLGYYYHDDSDNQHYRCYHHRTAYVEVIVGEGGYYLDKTVGVYEYTPDNKLNHRVYLTNKMDGVPTDNWFDVSNTGIVTPLFGKYEINVDEGAWYPCVISDKKFLAYGLKINLFNGIYSFDIRERVLVDDIPVWKTIDIPMGNLALWLNGRWLVEKVDYFVKWPKVVITNKEYLVDGDIQDVVLRANGFCNEDMSLIAPEETGFVVNGYLSYDKNYDIRDNKVLSMFVDGKLRMRDTLEFAEEISKTQVPNARNGAPYEVKENIISIRDAGYSDTYVLRNIDRKLDKKISNYRDFHTPQTIINSPNFINYRYKVVSPYMQRILFALENRQIDPLIVKGQYSDQRVRELVEPYNMYLEFDPVSQNISKSYVEVHAHGYNHLVGVSIHNYNFLARVNKIMLDGKVNLSQQLYIV